MKYRIKFWSHCAGVTSLFGKGTDSIVMIYKRCLSQGATSSIRGVAALHDFGIQGEILRDITRTFPNRPMFKSTRSKGQDMLADILKAVAVYDPMCGYCQGMNFVCATLMICVAESCLIQNKYKLVALESNSHGEDASSSSSSSSVEDAEDSHPPTVIFIERNDKVEAQVFGLMISMIHNFDMRDLWRPGVPQLKLRIYQFDRILGLRLPNLHSHFKKIGLSPDFFASQWFLTLLSYNLAYHDLVHAWDILFSDGWKTIFRIGLAILSSVESTLMGFTMEETAQFFRNRKGLGGEVISRLSSNGKEGIYQLVLSFKVSTKILIEMERDYIQHVLQQQLSDRPDNHGLMAFVDKRVATQVQEEISLMNIPVREDVKILRAKVETAEALLRAAHYAFQVAANEHNIIQTELEELLQAKMAIMQQLTALMMMNASSGNRSSHSKRDRHNSNNNTIHPRLEADIRALQAKIEAIEVQMASHSSQFGAVLRRTTQAQVDLEEAMERKKAYSEILSDVLNQSEAAKTQTLLKIFREHVLQQ